MICYSMCGSFCTLKGAVAELEKLVSRGFDVLPVMSEKVYSTDTRFGKACEYVKKVEDLTGKKVIHTIEDAEPVGPIFRPDAAVICPCTGNTLAKLANGITDSSVTMAAKSHLRNGLPLVIALSSNDSLSANLVNIGKLMARKNVYFVPLEQDDPEGKPSSLSAKYSLLGDTLEKAFVCRQIMPVFLGGR